MHKSIAEEPKRSEEDDVDICATRVRMNLVKASRILTLILYENVTDIVLSYMNPKDEQVKAYRPNMYHFFMTNNFILFKMEELYQKLSLYMSRTKCFYYYAKCDSESCRCGNTSRTAIQLGSHDVQVRDDIFAEYYCGLGNIRWEDELANITDHPMWIKDNSYVEYRIEDDILFGDIPILLCNAFLKDYEIECYGIEEFGVKELEDTEDK